MARRNAPTATAFAAPSESSRGARTSGRVVGGRVLGAGRPPRDPPPPGRSLFGATRLAVCGGVRPPPPLLLPAPPLAGGRAAPPLAEVPAAPAFGRFEPAVFFLPPGGPPAPGPGPDVLPTRSPSERGGRSDQAVGTAPTMLFTFTPRAGNDPISAALPKAKIPPSEPMSQYPWPSGVGTMATMFDTVTPSPGRDPNDWASPKENTEPSLPTSQ